jgi:hypothetical protein
LRSVCGFLPPSRWQSVWSRCDTLPSPPPVSNPRRRPGPPGVPRPPPPALVPVYGSQEYQAIKGREVMNPPSIAEYADTSAKPNYLKGTTAMEVRTSAPSPRDCLPCREVPTPELTPSRVAWLAGRRMGVRAFARLNPPGLFVLGAAASVWAVGGACSPGPCPHKRVSLGGTRRTGGQAPSPRSA